jgi:hypothetical protein
MNESPWSAYGRVPPPANGYSMRPDDPVAGVVNEAIRGREQVEKYLDGIVREYYAIRSGESGYGKIIADALTPSERPETIEERLKRLARDARTARLKDRSQRTGRR